MGRKAQITVFMIIGIILLFSSALIFYIKNQVVEGIPAEFVPSVEEVPLEAQPVKLYVENCINRITAEALVHAGAHGGYIDPSDRQYGRVFASGPFPTESDALAVFEGGQALVPYWWYLKSSNNCRENCQFGSNRPPLTKAQGQFSVEEQTETYLKKNLGRCLQDFTSFRDQGFNIQVKGDIEPEVKFTEEDTAVLVNYPISVSKEGRTTEVKQFFTKVDINMKEIYHMASEIMNSEVSMQFIEHHTLNLISFYSKPVGTDRLPPMAHFDMSPGGEYLLWTRTETEQRLENNVLPPGIAMLQVIDTSNYRRNIIMDEEGVDRVATGYMDKTIITLNSSEKFPFDEARFTYLDWWPIYLKINGGDEILRPKKIGTLVTGFLFDMIGLEQYRFLYSLSFPVLITVKDPFALNREGYKFTFALEANIRKNTPMNSSYEGVLPLPSPSLLCDPDQANAGPIRVTIKDAITGEPVPDARIEFISGDESCFIGFTELDDETNTTYVETNFPVGIGEIKIVKDDYLPLRTPIAAFLDESQNLSYEMMPIFNVNASVTPLALQYQEGRYMLPQVPISSLSPKETVILTLDRIPDEMYGEFSSYLVYNATSGPDEIPLVPGTYELNGYLMNSNPLIIPKETKTVDIPFKKDEVVELNETRMDEWLAGGVILNNKTGLLTITTDQLVNNKRVKFKVLKFPRPSTHSKEMGSGPSLEQVTEHELMSDVYRTDLEPEWSQ